MDAPAGRAFQAFGALRTQHRGQNAARPVDESGVDAAVVVILDQPFQSLVADAPNPHVSYVRRYRRVE
jgi:hypothetical protein